MDSAISDSRSTSRDGTLGAHMQVRTRLAGHAEGRRPDTSRRARRHSRVAEGSVPAHGASRLRGELTQRRDPAAMIDSLRGRIPARVSRSQGVVLVIVAVVAFMALMLYGPASDWYVALREGQDLQRRYDVLAAENDTLADDLERLQSREGIEDEARRRGYVSKGETSVVVENLPQDLGEPGSAGQGGQDMVKDDRDLGTKLLDLLFGYTPASSTAQE